MIRPTRFKSSHPYTTQGLPGQLLPGISNVPKGMFGNGQAPGWIARGLPVVTLEEARDDYRADLLEKTAK